MGSRIQRDRNQENWKAWKSLLGMDEDEEKSKGPPRFEKEPLSYQSAADKGLDVGTKARNQLVKYFSGKELPPSPDDNMAAQFEDGTGEDSRQEKDFSFFETTNKGVEAAEAKKPSYQPAPMPKIRQRDRAGTSDLEAELDKASDLYRNAQSVIDKREAIEAFFNGIGRIGAGLAGRATGTDMSGVKFDRQDWDKKREREDRLFSEKLSDVRQRGRDREAQHQFDVRADQADAQFTEAARANRANEAHRHASLEEQIRHNKEIEQLNHGKLKESAIKAITDQRAKYVKEVKAASEKTRESLLSVYNNQNMTDEEKRAAFRSIISEQTGLSPERAQALITEKGWFSDDKDLDDILNDLTTLFYFQAYKTDVLQKAKAQDPDAIVLYRTKPDGQPEWMLMSGGQESQVPNGWTILQ